MRRVVINIYTRDEIVSRIGRLEEDIRSLSKDMAIPFNKWRVERYRKEQGFLQRCLLLDCQQFALREESGLALQLYDLEEKDGYVCA